MPVGAWPLRFAQPRLLLSCHSPDACWLEERTKAPVASRASSDGKSSTGQNKCTKASNTSDVNRAQKARSLGQAEDPAHSSRRVAHGIGRPLVLIVIRSLGKAKDLVDLTGKTSSNRGSREERPQTAYRGSRGSSRSPGLKGAARATSARPAVDRHTQIATTTVLEPPA